MNRTLLAAALTLTLLPALPAAAGEWYSGGTLHQSTVADWHAATDENRLATAADFTVGHLGAPRVIAMGGPAVARPLAVELMKCVNGGTADNAAILDQKIKAFATICAVMMGWPSK